VEQRAVTAGNFVRAESNRIFADLVAVVGGVNRFHQLRVPTPVGKQGVIQMNRDTLWSHAIVDLAEAAELTVPDAGDRYLSMMVVNHDHSINRVFHDPDRCALRQPTSGPDTSDSPLAS
jgi:hypothetical protein